MSAPSERRMLAQSPYRWPHHLRPGSGIIRNTPASRVLHETEALWSWAWRGPLSEGASLQIQNDFPSRGGGVGVGNCVCINGRTVDSWGGCWFAGTSRESGVAGQLAHLLVNNVLKRYAPYCPSWASQPQWRRWGCVEGQAVCEGYVVP